MDQYPSHGSSDPAPDAGRPEEPTNSTGGATPTPPPPPFGEPTATQGAVPPGSPEPPGWGWNAPGATWSAASTPPPYGTEPDGPEPTSPGEPTIPSAAWVPAPPPRSTVGSGGSHERASGMRTAIAAAVVGAVVGALAAGGIVAAVDDNGNTRTIVEAPATNANARPAAVIQSPGDIQAILAKVTPAVVRINVTINSGFNGSEQGVGTGFIIDSDGVIVTNAHVVENADSVVVQLSNGRQVNGRVLGASSESDLAVVKIDGKNLPTVQLGNSDNLEVGDQVVAIGNALGLEGAPTVTSGIVSGLNRVLQEPASNGNPDGVQIPNTIQTDAAINPGNSGGPLVDANGDVIGINTAIANPSESNNVGFAIAITPAKPVIDSLRNGQQPHLAFLGVGTQAVTSDVKDQFNLRVDQGAYVTSVSNGSAADSAGIRQGDVITKVAGKAVTSSEDVINAVRAHAPGDKISVTVNRNGTQKTVQVTLRARPNA
jgi:S1-C subfamily serine protease